MTRSHRTILFSAGLSALSVLGAHLYGRALHLANPNGLLMYTPAVGVEPIREPAYPLGFMLGGGGTALCVFFAALSFYLSARFFWPTFRVLATQVLVASLISGLVVFAAVLVVESSHQSLQDAPEVFVDES